METSISKYAKRGFPSFCFESSRFVLMIAMEAAATIINILHNPEAAAPRPLEYHKGDATAARVRTPTRRKVGGEDDGRPTAARTGEGFGGGFHCALTCGCALCFCA